MRRAALSRQRWLVKLRTSADAGSSANTDQLMGPASCHKVSKPSLNDGFSLLEGYKNRMERKLQQILRFRKPPPSYSTWSQEPQASWVHDMFLEAASMCVTCFWQIIPSCLIFFFLSSLNIISPWEIPRAISLTPLKFFTEQTWEMKL